MKNIKQELMHCLATAALCDAMLAGALLPTTANELHCEWISQNGLDFWVEHGEIQGTSDDPKGVRDTQYNGTVRGREIYDPISDGWYWLDACRMGAKATGKEVWMPYVFQDEKPGSTNGKWVIYDEDGKMVKGWCFRVGRGWYYYDHRTGSMAKGWKLFGNGAYGYLFDRETGVLIDDLGNAIGFEDGCMMIRHVICPDETAWYESDWEFTEFSLAKEGQRVGKRRR